MVAARKGTLRNVEFASKESSGKRKRGGAIFQLRLLVCETRPRRVHLREFDLPEIELKAESAPATSTLPAEIASSSSAPTFPAESAPSTTATDVPGQVMSEGASSSFNTGIKRSSGASSSSESGAKRFHADHSTSDVVILLDDSKVSLAVSRSRKVCRDRGAFLVDVNDWDSESRDCLRALGSDGTTVACSSGGATRKLMSNESRLF